MSVDNPLIKSYVWFGEKCFYVNTFDRDSSAMLGPRRYAETIVWEYDWETDTRGNMIAQRGGLEGTIFTHEQMCRLLLRTGSAEIPEEQA